MAAPVDGSEVQSLAAALHLVQRSLAKPMSLRIQEIMQAQERMEEIWRRMDRRLAAIEEESKGRGVAAKVLEKQDRQLDASMKTASEKLLPKVQTVMPQLKNNSLPSANPTPSTSSFNRPPNALPPEKAESVSSNTSSATVPHLDSKKRRSTQKCLLGAAKKGREEKVSRLIIKGADVNYEYILNKTALHFAAEKGRLGVISLLIASGADRNRQDKNRETPLHFAAKEGHTEAVLVLIAEGAEVNRGNNIAYTPLHIAAQNGHKDAVHVLIAAGAEVNRGNINANTPLHCAAQNGHRDVVQVLITAGAEVNRGIILANTPLHFAALNGHIDAVQALIAACAGVNSKDRNGNTPVMMAVSKGHRETVEVLFALGEG